MRRTYSLMLLFAALFFLLPMDIQAQGDAPAPEEVTVEVIEDGGTPVVEPPPADEPEEAEMPEEAPEEAVDPEEPAEQAESAELQSSEEVLDTVQLIIDAAKEGKWGLVVAGVLMILVWVLRRFLWTSLPKEYLPYITVGVAGVVAFAGAVLAEVAVVDALWVAVGGLMTGLTGVGFWELIGKKILPKNGG